MSIKIYGISGEAEHGKSMVGSWLLTHEGALCISFAYPFKEWVASVFELPQEAVWGTGKQKEIMLDARSLWEKAESAPSQFFNILKVVPPKLFDVAATKLLWWKNSLKAQYPQLISPRIILQTLGTEWGRSIDPDLWANYTLDVVIPRIDQVAAVAITDVRFLNELDAIKKHGGYVFRVRRLAKVRKDTNAGIQGHASEIEQRSIPDSYFDAVFEFEEGIEKAHWKLCEAFAKREWER